MYIQNSTEQEFVKLFKTTIMIDLFEHYETLPQEVQDLILTITDEFDYEDCKQMVLSLNDLGYTCEYGLDAQLFNLSVL